MEIKLPQAVLELHLFTSKDSSRENLQYIQVESDGPRRMIAIATDGHRLTTYTWLHADAEAACPKPILIRGSAAKACLASVPKKSRGGGVYRDGALGMGELSSFRCAPSEAVTFPEWRGLLPVGEGGYQAMGFGFNPAYTADTSKYLKRCSTKAQGVKFTRGPGEDLTGPMVFEATAGDGLDIGDVTFVIMPMRI